METEVENDLSFIINFVEECWPGFQITPHLLEHPTSDFVFEFYDRVRNDIQFLLNQIVDNKNAETSLQVQAEGDPVFDLLRFINKYLRKLSFGQADCALSLSDLYEPTAKRTKIRFKVLLNLLIFYEEHVEKCRGLVVKRQTQVEDHMRKKKEKEQLKTALAQEAEKLAHLEDEREKLQREFAKAELRYAKTQEQKDDSERRLKKLQHDLKMFADTYQNKHTLLTNIKTNMQHLNEQVVAVDGQKCLIDLKNVLEDKLTELNTEVSYATTNLESRKPTIERFLNIEKQIRSSDYEQLKTSFNNVVDAKAQLLLVQPKYEEKIKEIQKLRETELVYKENAKGKHELLQSELLRDKILLEQVKQEMKQITIEEGEEKSLQDGINKEKIILQEKISVEHQKCAEITSYVENFNNLCGNMYSNILSVENNTTSGFNKNLSNMAKAISEAAHSSDTDFTSFKN